MKQKQNKKASGLGPIIGIVSLGTLLFLTVLTLFCVSLFEGIRKERANQEGRTAEIEVNTAAPTAEVIGYEDFFGTADEPSEGIGREEKEETNVVRDIASPDWNLNTQLSGANGLTAEAWEIDLLTRIVSREACGCSETCWTAICDAILNRVSCGYWGSSIFEVVSAVEEGGAYAFTTWPDVYNGAPIELYDEIRAVCEREFYNGAQFPDYVKYFNLYGFATWDGAVPCYEIEGVFFSASEWLEGWR